MGGSEAKHDVVVKKNGINASELYKGVVIILLTLISMGMGMMIRSQERFVDQVNEWKYKTDSRIGNIETNDAVQDSKINRNTSDMQVLEIKVSKIK
jgi:hypothetical protein